SPAEIDRALDVNLRAPIQLARALVPPMLERRSGHLVFISSLAGKVATARSALYSATKFGVRAFAAGLREDLHGSGVGATTVFPGFIRDAGLFADSGVELPRGVGPPGAWPRWRACRSGAARQTATGFARSRGGSAGERLRPSRSWRPPVPPWPRISTAGATEPCT